MEDFVPFEIAKNLKEKGFREGCFGYYGYCKDVFYYNVIQNPIPSRQLTFKDFKDCKNRYRENNRYDAPTISQVLKWLRDEKDIDLVTSPVFFYDDVLGKMRKYECEVFTPSLDKPEHCGYREEWEQATLAGIEYVLDNLI